MINQSDLTAADLARWRADWRQQPLDDETIACYRVNYDPLEWAKSSAFPCLPFGAALAIDRLICEVERLRERP